MAEHSTHAAAFNSGVEVVQSIWSRIYRGTKENLVAAKIVPAGVAFPGERDPKICKTTPYRFTATDGRICKIRRHGKSRFAVLVPLSPEEANAAKAKAALAQQAAAAERELRVLTGRTAQDWREREARSFVAAARAGLIGLSGDKSSGFYLRQTDIDAIFATLEQVADRIRNAPVYFNKERHDARRQQLLAACAADNDALQSFLLQAQAHAGQAS